MRKNTFITLLAFFALAISTASHSQQRNEQSGKRTPPKEALNACVDKSAGQQCVFEGRKGSESGTCFAPSEELPLACKPAGKGEGGKKKKN